MTPPLTGGASTVPLRRGKACMKCRRPKDETCQYGPTTPRIRTRTKPLESTVASLVARVEQLEHSSNSPSSIQLFDPYLPEPESHLGYRRLHLFLDHAPQFGFFLDPERFMQSVRYIDDHISCPSPSLLNSILLWGAHLSSNTDLEVRFKSIALQRTAALGVQPFLYTLQAEVLLGYYLFRTGAFLEARVHTNTALELALSGGLHQICVSTQTADVVEQGERINAFWAVFVLHNNLGAAMGDLPDAAAVGGMQIDTPWPLDMDEYKQGVFSRGSQATVLKYLRILSATPEYSDHGSSLLALNAKACILLNQALWLPPQWNSNVAGDVQSLYNVFQLVNDRILELRGQMSSAATRNGASIRLLTHSLLYAATIKLHDLFTANNVESRRICLDAARAMFRFEGMDLHSLGYLNPMMATLLKMAYDVLVAEHYRISQTNRPSSQETHEAHATLGDARGKLDTLANLDILKLDLSLFN
ncbi:hypothetical protein FB45DRAFT_998826 [Roridomyces roridus]|uniref:Xylanolytic transcriptional activator regulatory domain-containing protein n=1 Tax=Roridomyces roridus TaxID=1738132 RepID=A0AAD7G139_9AGAR|nr:hypothetical protein FB45DRAFT_998826 [Roridomyces roridus]